MLAKGNWEYRREHCNTFYRTAAIDNIIYFVVNVDNEYKIESSQHHTETEQTTKADKRYTAD